MRLKPGLRNVALLKAGRIMRCPECRTYTLKEYCPRCGGRTASPHPIHFTPESRYASLLLKARKSRAEKTT
ncbi:MAG: nucleolar RNA-binding Nop10p family protein [Candidatus Caldarchaeum sp.]